MREVITPLNDKYEEYTDLDNYDQVLSKLKDSARMGAAYENFDAKNIEAIDALLVKVAKHVCKNIRPIKRQ